ncbi:pentatricopeptide repeat-containing protein at4g21705 mitochondrial [Phtheirospermum japonicum]|uniref:Pentatricopeptide repeat-containing protein at4g21705 mitochondrial n=1 Tax=Phtheirospermum japonicum TaxID=374723 RepID=A0A830D6P8_9LAMI|nr:pentatricopeptide repeat-containing protein at4g21705 mitochondrial [Phtheirospermum japonicum]
MQSMPQTCSQSIALSNSSMFAALNRSNLLRLYPHSRNLIAFKKFFSCAIAVKSTVNPTANAPSYSTSRSRNLFSRISPVRQDHVVVQVLDQWVAEGRDVQPFELRRIIRDLRSRRRFSQALQISEWISSNRAFTLLPGDCAVHLDLIGVVHGCEAAETYFNNLNDPDKNEKTYGALLNCYVREGLSTKTLHHMQTMRDLGYASSALTYNTLMALYKKSGELDKISETLSEMKKNGVAPNNFTYRICFNSFSEKSDPGGMEKLLDEMEHIDWATYSTVASHFIKAGEKERALTYMKLLEENLDKDALGYNHLITLYARLGNKDEMMRLWVLQKTVCKKQINRDYITMLDSLVKLGELEMAEAVLKDWDSSCHTYDLRVPNILLIAYCQKGLIEKAEIILRNIVKKGKKPTPNSWAIVGSGFLDKGNFEKAFECMKEALDAKERNVKWRPKPGLIGKLLNWVGDRREIEEVEAFVRSLRQVVKVNRQMYRALIKASVRAGRDTSLVLGRMTSDGIDVDDEIAEMLRVKMSG